MCYSGIEIWFPASVYCLCIKQFNAFGFWKLVDKTNPIRFPRYLESIEAHCNPMRKSITLNFSYDLHTTPHNFNPKYFLNRMSTILYPCRKPLLHFLENSPSREKKNRTKWTFDISIVVCRRHSPHTSIQQRGKKSRLVHKKSMESVVFSIVTSKQLFNLFEQECSSVKPWKWFMLLRSRPNAQKSHVLVGEEK